MAEENGDRATNWAGAALDWCWGFPSCAAALRGLEKLEEVGLDAWQSADMVGLGADSIPLASVAYTRLDNLLGLDSWSPAE